MRCSSVGVMLLVLLTAYVYCIVLLDVAREYFSLDERVDATTRFPVWYASTACLTTVGICSLACRSGTDDGEEAETLLRG